MFQQINKYFFGLFLLSCLYVGTVEAKTDKILAVVNESVITQSEVDSRISAMQNHLMQNSTLEKNIDVKQLKNKILNDLIDRELQFQVAQRNDVKITEKQLDVAVEGIAQRNNLSLEQFKQELAKQNISYSDFRKQIREEMILGQVSMQAVGSSVNVTDQEVNALLQKEKQKTAKPEFKEYHLLDVIVPYFDDVKKADNDKAIKIAVDVLDDLSNGAIVEEIVKKHDVNGKKIEGADLGWRAFNDLPEQFKEIVLKLNKSEAAGPIKAPNGFHIVILLDVRKNNAQAQQQTAQQMTKDDAKQMLYHEKLTKAMQPWLQQLRASAFIKIMD